MRRGGRYLAEISHTTSGLEKYHLQWSLMSDEYLHDAGEISPQSNGNALFTIPDRGDDLRLYLFADDGKGHVSTASAVVVIDEK